jgi:Rrf2 family protein
MLTATGQYALRAMGALAQRPLETYSRAQELGRDLGMPPLYLSKVMQQLARAGLLLAKRGRQGGYRLAREPQKIRLYEILAAVEPVARYESCILGHRECCETTACPVHEAWVSARSRVLSLLQKTPLSDLAVTKEVLQAEGAAASTV